MRTLNVGRIFRCTTRGKRSAASVSGFSPLPAGQAGFTLIEMMVTISITALLLSIIVGLNRTGQRQIFLFKERALLVANLNRIKSTALQTFLMPSRPCGFGIHIDAPGNRYILFEDTATIPGDCTVVSANRVYDPGEEMIEGGVAQIYLIDTTSVRIRSSSFLDVIYVPPDPLVFIDYPANSGIGTVVLETIDGNGQTTVQVNNAGQITAF